MPKTKILLDTDIGTDSDDAVCLAYLLAHAEVELVGITTVGHDAAVRADIAKAICAVFGRADIPVAAGADRALLLNPYWDGHRVNQHVILDGPPQWRAARPAAAVELMRSCLDAAPGEVVVLTVGPLTNLALLATNEPAAMARAKAVFSMAGAPNLDPSHARMECNGMLDGAATGIAFQRQLNAHTICPVGITGGRGLSHDEARRMLAGDRLAVVRRCCDAWDEARGRRGTGLHDPFTAACILDDSFCTWAQGYFHVEIRDHDLKEGRAYERGRVAAATYFEERKDGPHRMAVEADYERCVLHLEQTLDRVR